MGDLVHLPKKPHPLVQWFMGWLASPCRVMALPIRVCTAFAILVPIYYAVTLNAPGILLFEVVLSLPVWALMTVAVHGSTKMYHSNPPIRLWLWRHVTAWWVIPEGA